MENLIYNVLFTFKNLNCESSQRPWNIKAVYCAIKYGKKNSPSEFVKNTQNLIRLDSGASMRLEAKKSKQNQFNKLIYKYNPNTFFLNYVTISNSKCTKQKCDQTNSQYM